MSDPYAEFSKPVGGNDPYAEFSKPVSTGKPRQQDAVKALSQASAALDKQLAGLPEEARRIGRQKFNADPRIKDLVAQVNAGLPKEEQTTLSQLATSAKQRGAALVKSIASIPDVVTEAVAGGMRLENRAVDTLGGLAMQAFGASPERIAAYHQAGAQADKALSQPVTVRRSVERVVAPPTDTAGKIADFGTEVLGGFINPATMVKAPVTAQQTTLSTLAKAKPVFAAERAAANPAAEVIEQGAKYKVPVMTSDVAPPTTFLGKLGQSITEKIPFAGTGGPRAAQQVARGKAVEQLVDETGANSAALSDVAADLSAKRSADLGRLTAQKDEVINAVQDVVPVPRTIAAIDSEIADLRRVGTDASKAVIAKLENWKQAIQEAPEVVQTGILDASGKPITKTIAPQSKNLATIDKIRAEMGEAFSGPDLANIRSTGEKALSRIYGPMKEDMGAFIKSAQGDEAFGKWSGANEQLSEMAGELGVNRLRSVLNTADMTPENVGNLLFSAKPSEVELLMKNLSPVGQARARGAIIQRAFEKAGGIENMTPDKFLQQIKALGSPIGVAFKGDEGAALQGFTRLLKATKRGAEAGVAPPTGVQNTPVLAGYTLGTLLGPVAIPTAGIGGLLARAYESAPVRDLVVRLARTAPGSRNEATILRQLAPRLSAIAANNNEVSGALSSKVGVPLAASDGEENE